MKTTLNHPDELDPQLSALLDEALSPEGVPGGVPDDLAGRVFARLRPQLEDHGPRVAGRIRPMQSGLWAAATAAVVALAVGGAMWVGSFADRSSTPVDLALDSQVIENELEMLALEIEFLRADGPWQALHDNLDRDMAEWELSHTDLVTHF